MIFTDIQSSNSYRVSAFNILNYLKFTVCFGFFKVFIKEFLRIKNDTMGS